MSFCPLILLFVVCRLQNSFQIDSTNLSKPRRCSVVRATFPIHEGTRRAVSSPVNTSVTVQNRNAAIVNLIANGWHYVLFEVRLPVAIVAHVEKQRRIATSFFTSVVNLADVPVFARNDQWRQRKTLQVLRCYICFGTADNSTSATRDL